MMKNQDDAYSQRNMLVAAISRTFPSGTAKTDIPGWDPKWHNCVYIDLPEGQISFHYHDDDAWMFKHLPPYEGEWDAHTDEVKWARIDRQFGIT